MWNESQILYLTEVLGIDPHLLRVESQSSPKLEGVVVSPLLEQAETELLEKILRAAGLQNWPRLDSLNGSEPSYVLSFEGRGQGRSRQGNAEWIYLPRVVDLMGEGPRVTQLKKQVWDELKGFKT